MSVGKKSSTPPSRREEEGDVENGGDDAVAQKESSSGGKKQAGAARYGRCFSGLELSIGPGPLKDVDASKLKGQIKRWARTVVAYARQLSFGSPRSSSPRMSSGGTTPRSATLPSKSKSGLGGAKGDAEPPP